MFKTCSYLRLRCIVNLYCVSLKGNNIANSQIVVKRGHFTQSFINAGSGYTVAVLHFIPKHVQETIHVFFKVYKTKQRILLCDKCLTSFHKMSLVCMVWSYSLVRNRQAQPNESYAFPLFKRDTHVGLISVHIFQLQIACVFKHLF